MTNTKTKQLAILAIMLLFLPLYSSLANPTTKGYSIVGTISGLGDKMIYLRKESHIVSGFIMKIDIDSTLSKDGYFRFDGVMEEPAYAFLEIYGHSGPGPRRFILDNSNFTVTLNNYNSTVYNPPHIEGGYSNKVLGEFYDFIEKEYDAEIDYKNRSLDPLTWKDTSNKNSITYNKNAYDRKLGEFIKNNPNEFVSLYQLKGRPQLSMSIPRINLHAFESDFINQLKLGGKASMVAISKKGILKRRDSF